MGLFALACAMIANALLTLIFVLFFFGRYLRILVSMKHTASHLWRHEIMQLLWKYAISWSSGYFLFQLFTPLMFHFPRTCCCGKSRHHFFTLDDDLQPVYRMDICLNS